MLKILSFDFIKKLNTHLFQNPTFSLTFQNFAMQFQGYALVPNQRFCAACPGKVGDEYHFLTECVSHSENSDILFKEITKEIPNCLIQSNKGKFISILTTQNMNVLLSLAKCIVKAWG